MDKSFLTLPQEKKRKRINQLFRKALVMTTAFEPSAAPNAAPSMAPSDSRMPILTKKNRLAGLIQASQAATASESGSDASREQLQVMLECPQCTDIYKDPHILTCQHTLCKHCMDDVSEDDVIICPVCTTESLPSEAQPDINKQQLLAILGEERKPERHSDDSDFDSDEEEDRIPTCEVCKKPIQWYCLDCNQWLCNDCKFKHAKFKATRGHKLDHIVAVAREHRSKLEKHYSDIHKAEEKLHTIISKSEAEIKSAQEQEATALKDSEQTRQETLDLVNARFDEIDQKITDFVSNRVDDLKILKLRSESLLLELAEKSEYLSGFLSKQPPIIVTKGGKIASDLNEYLGMTTLPRVEFRDTIVHFKKGTKFIAQAVGSYDLKGGHTQVNVPIVLRNILKHADNEVAPLPAPKAPTKKVAMPKSKATDARYAMDGQGENSGGESYGISNMITSQADPENGTPRNQEKQLMPRSKRGGPVVKNITRDLNHSDDIGRLTPRVTAGSTNTSKSRLSRRTPVPKAVAFDSLKQLMKLRYHLSAVVSIVTKPVSIRVVNGHVWCSHGDVITIWNTDLELVNTVDHGLLKQVQSVAGLRSGRVAVASGAGLHLLGPEGQYDGRVSDECYIDVDTCDNMLYAVLFGAVTRAKMHVYDEDKPWDLLRTVVMPSDGLCTINVSSLEGMMYVCSYEHGIVYVTTLNGEVIRRCGRKGVYGGPGYFNKPRICHGDMEGSVLVADKRNQCLQVHNIDGEWMVVNLQETPERPACAAFVQRQLFVLQTETSWRLMKYTT